MCWERWTLHSDSAIKFSDLVFGRSFLRHVYLFVSKLWNKRFNYFIRSFEPFEHFTIFTSRRGIWRIPRILQSCSQFLRWPLKIDRHSVQQDRVFWESNSKFGISFGGLWDPPKPFSRSQIWICFEQTNVWEFCVLLQLWFVGTIWQQLQFFQAIFLVRWHLIIR